MSTFVNNFPSSKVARFCQRWKISELAVFGSALRDDFGPGSDIDVLVTFSNDSNWGLLEHVQMEQELEVLFHRKVDLISRRGLDRNPNWVLREEILKTAKTLHLER